MTERPYVSVRPAMKGGSPCLHGHRLTAEMIAGLVWDLGEDLQAEVLDAYEITREDVLVCCWFQAEYGTRTWRKRWKAWLDQTWAMSGEGTGWWGTWADLPMPPTRKESRP